MLARRSDAREMLHNEIGSDLPSLVVMVVSAWSLYKHPITVLPRSRAPSLLYPLEGPLSLAAAEKGASMIPLAIPEAAVWPGASACGGPCSRERSRKPRPPWRSDAFMRSLPERSGSWIPLSFQLTRPQTRVPVCRPIGADRQGRLVPRRRVKRLDIHEVRSMRHASSACRNAGGDH